MSSVNIAGQISANETGEHLPIPTKQGVCIAVSHIHLESVKVDTDASYVVHGSRMQRASVILNDLVMTMTTLIGTFQGPCATGFPP